MSGAPTKQARGTRLARAVVAAASLFVRRSLRPSWREEWCAELESAASGGVPGVRLLLRALGSFFDAMHTHVLPAGYDRLRDASPTSTAATDGLLHDVRWAWRGLRRSPAYASVAAATLALAIGAVTAIYTVVGNVLLEPPRFPEPERLVRVWSYHPAIGRTTASAPDFADWREQSRSFAHLAAVTQSNATLRSGSSPDQDPERVLVARVTRGWFEMLGVDPVIGRWPSADEDAVGAAPVAVLAFSMWQSRFGGDPAIVGRTIDLDGEELTVIGIAPLETFPRSSGIFLPAALDLSSLGRRNDFLSVFGRLRPEIGRLEAEEELRTIAARLEREFPGTNALRTVEVQPFHDYLVARARPALYALLGAVGFLLLIACANVANLTLARASRRGGELAVRAALGAGGARLVRQALIEALLVAAAGGAAGLLLGAGLLRAMLALEPSLPRLDEVRLDGDVLWFSAVLTISTALLFGLLPALRARGVAPQRALRSSGARSTGGGSGSRAWLAGAQVALALVLTVGAGLMLRSFDELRREEVGFRTGGLATARLALAEGDYPQDAQVAAFWDRLLERLAAAPEVAAAAATNALPLRDGADYLSFGVEGRPPAGDGEVQDAEVRAVTPGFFELAGVPLLRGRTLEPSDREGATAVAVINETMARRYWPEGDSLGARITFADSAAGPFLDVVGVVGDVRHELSEDPYPQIWVAAAQQPPRVMTLLVQAAAGREAAESLHPVVRREVAALDPRLAVFGETTLQRVVAEELAQPRFGATLLAAFATVALLLSAVGLYGVLAMAVAERSREIGLRVALGASRGRVLIEVARRSALVVGIGVMVGLAASIALARLLRALWHEVGPADPIALGSGTGVLLLVAALATFLPARRAGRVDPMRVLREE